MDSGRERESERERERERLRDRERERSGMTSRGGCGGRQGLAEDGKGSVWSCTGHGTVRQWSVRLVLLDRVGPEMFLRERAAALAALFGRFLAPRLNGAGFSSRRPGSRADFGRGPSPRPGATRQRRQTHPKGYRNHPRGFQGSASGSSEAQSLSFSALPSCESICESDDCHNRSPFGGMSGGYARMTFLLF